MKKIQVFLFGIFISRWAVADFSCPLTVNNFDAIYEPNEYTCNSGEFLPADGIECALCPSGYTCPGGTFNFDPDRFGGLTISTISGASVTNACAANMPVNFDAVYEPNEYTCNAGYYLPADGIECVQCTSNNVCVGGTYSFNETTDQGIQSCTNDTFAPSGSTVCYPHILHVGDSNVYLKSIKQTTPSLNIKIGNDIFYANMTTEHTKMNKDSSHYFRVQWENNDYYICDDTTCPQ